MENNVIIDLKNISVSFDGEQILKNINLYIRDGEFITFLGPSGCGKTTTLRIIAGFLEPDGGDVIFDGKKINGVPPHKREVNTIFQRYALFPHLNVFENVAFGLRIKKMPENEIKQKVEEMLKLVNLSGLEKNSGFKIRLSMALKMLYGMIYGDLIMLLKNQVEPYEVNKGDTKNLTQKWIDTISTMMSKGKGFSMKEARILLPEITKTYAEIKVNKTEKVKVGVVGEIYVKYSALANNHLEEFLASQDCEVMVPGLLGFFLFKVDNRLEDIKLYGGNPFKKIAMQCAM